MQWCHSNPWHHWKQRLHNHNCAVIDPNWKFLDSHKKMQSLYVSPDISFFFFSFLFIPILSPFLLYFINNVPPSIVSESRRRSPIGTIRCCCCLLQDLEPLHCSFQWGQARSLWSLQAGHYWWQQHSSAWLPRLDCMPVFQDLLDSYEFVWIGKGQVERLELSQGLEQGRGHEEVHWGIGGPEEETQLNWLAIIKIIALLFSY